MSRGDPLTCVSPKSVAQSADVTLLPGVYFRPHYAAYRKPYYAKKTATALSNNGLTQIVPEIAANKARFKRVDRPSMATSTTSEVVYHFDTSFTLY